MFYVGFCPVCETGPLGIRICGGQQDLVVLCDECDAVWVTANCSEEPTFPAQPELPCPICGGTLCDAPAHWATRQELEDGGWLDMAVGEGDALGESEIAGWQDPSDPQQEPEDLSG